MLTAHLNDRSKQQSYSPPLLCPLILSLSPCNSSFYLVFSPSPFFNTTPLLEYHSEALHVLCSSSEFDQLKLRPEELSEIDQLKKDAVVAVKGAHLLHTLVSLHVMHTFSHTLSTSIIPL